MKKLLIIIALLVGATSVEAAQSKVASVSNYGDLILKIHNIQRLIYTHVGQEGNQVVAWRNDQNEDKIAEITEEANKMKKELFGINGPLGDNRELRIILNDTSTDSFSEEMGRALSEAKNTPLEGKEKGKVYDAVIKMKFNQLLREQYNGHDARHQTSQDIQNLVSEYTSGLSAEDKEIALKNLNNMALDLLDDVSGQLPLSKKIEFKKSIRTIANKVRKDSGIKEEGGFFSDLLDLGARFRKRLFGSKKTKTSLDDGLFGDGTTDHITAADAQNAENKTKDQGAKAAHQGATIKDDQAEAGEGDGVERKSAHKTSAAKKGPQSVRADTQAKSKTTTVDRVSAIWSTPTSTGLEEHEVNVTNADKGSTSTRVDPTENGE